MNNIVEINRLIKSIEKTGYTPEKYNVIIGIIESVFDYSEMDDDDREDLFELSICDDCGEIIESYEDRYISVDEKILCESCRNENYFSCDDCGEISHTDDSLSTGDDCCICQDCYDNNYNRCSNCSEIYRSNDMHHDDNYSYCENCYTNHFFTCESCNGIYHIDDSNYDEERDEYFCNHCYEEKGEKGFSWLHPYGYHPVLKFYGENADLFFGTETEIDKGNRENFDNHMTIFPEKYFWCCTDGSLGDNGIEIISHPMTYNFIMENRPHKKMCDMALKSGYVSHNTNTCGTHIHMSRGAFGNDNDRLVNFVFLFEKFWREIVFLSRRKHNLNEYNPEESNIDRYSARYCNLDDDKEVKTVPKIKDKLTKNYGRYRVVNLTNNATIEIRIFRGTLQETTIIGSIQLCKLFFELSIFDADKLEKLNWSDVRDHAAQNNYNEFLDLCSKRGL